MTKIYVQKPIYSVEDAEGLEQDCLFRDSYGYPCRLAIFNEKPYVWSDEGLVELESYLKQRGPLTALVEMKAATELKTTRRVNGGLEYMVRYVTEWREKDD